MDPGHPAGIGVNCAAAASACELNDAIKDLPKTEAGALKESGETGAKAESLEVRRVGGEMVEFDSDTIASVPDLRARVGVSLRLAPSRLKLCVGDRVIEDDEPLSNLCRGGEITAVVITDW